MSVVCAIISLPSQSFTHSLASKDRARSLPRPAGFGAVCFLTLSTAKGRGSRPKTYSYKTAMEHSHIFPVLTLNGSWSPGQHPAEVIQGCPLGPLPVIYYSVLLCLGLPANILTVVILSQLVLRRQKSSYNYLLALAAADILVLLLIVFVDFILEDFILAMPLPPSLNSAVQVLEFSSIHTSIWITVPLTIDRYIAVCHPLRYHTVSYPARTRRVIFAVYIGCLLSAAPYYWWPELWHSLYGAGGVVGGDVTQRTAAQHVLVWAHCTTVYLLPCTVFFTLNAVIVRKLRRRRNCFRLRGYSTGKTTAILLAITSIFAVLWAPRTLMILYHFYSPPPASQGASQLLHLLTDLANMLALLNTGVNFFLYCFISKRFRGMAANVLRALLHCRKQTPPFYASHNFSITSSPWISPANSHCIKMLVYQYDKNGKPICISS
ncbi:probable G-protein coupled receptor 139 [Eucyclogobius newberryi]|uniref:probable G-protein coupled receptor 139 n=1 Tax=Eucyclogobius newberryi TaxID=166745 RepID=UPI003B5B7B5D